MPKVSKYPQSLPLEQFAIWRDGFTADEIEQIIFLESLQSFEKGVVGSESKKNLEARDSDIQWIHPDQNSAWIFDKFSEIISHVNRDHFMLDIDGFDAFQLTKYEEDQHYSWHWDYEFGYRTWVRKISCVMLLSDPEEYEGGEFEICLNGNFTKTNVIKPKKGDIIFFASWMPHRVLPVTSGERRSLVAWVMGKREC